MLTVRDLYVDYGQVAAVRGISFTVKEGETFAMVGPNGAGKSTTLNTIMGVVQPTRGAIEFDGSSLLGRRTDEIARSGLSLVPEGRRIFAAMSVKDNLTLALSAGTEDGDEDRLVAILDRFPVLKKLYGVTAGKLSGGEQQQLAIARALLVRPRLLLLDEPSLGLAPQYVDTVFEILAELREESVTMLLVEQNVQRTIEFADRTCIVRAGRIALTGAREELTARDDLAEAYLGAGGA
jgi:branched-chain amino acid transport system ATP-binding protein